MHSNHLFCAPFFYNNNSLGIGGRGEPNHRNRGPKGTSYDVIRDLGKKCTLVIPLIRLFILLTSFKNLELQSTKLIFIGQITDVIHVP